MCRMRCLSCYDVIGQMDMGWTVVCSGDEGGAKNAELLALLQMIGVVETGE